MHLRQRLQETTATFRPADEGASGAPSSTQEAQPAASSAPPAPAERVPPTPAEPVQAEPAKPEPPKRDWKDDRIAELTFKLNQELRNRAAATAPQKPGESTADFDARVEAAAAAKAQEIAAANDWNGKCNAVAAKGKEQFKDAFDSRMGAIHGVVNAQDPQEMQQYNEVLAIAIETGRAHEILYALGGNPGEFQKLMKMHPIRRTLEIAKLAGNLDGAPAPSNAPKPITPIGSNGQHYEGIKADDPNHGMKLPKSEWFKQREAQARARGIQ